MEKTLKQFVLTLAVLFMAAVCPAADFVPGHQTVGVQSIDVGFPSLVADSTCRVVMHAFASDHTGDVSVWSWAVAVRRIDDGVPAGVATLLARNNSVGAALWSAALVNNVEGPVIRITGVVGVTIDWLVVNEDAFCMAGPFA